MESLQKLYSLPTSESSADTAVVVEVAVVDVLTVEEVFVVVVVVGVVVVESFLLSCASLSFLNLLKNPPCLGVVGLLSFPVDAVCAGGLFDREMWSCCCCGKSTP